MKSVWTSAAALLLVTGIMLGLTLPFGKLATAAGIAPLVWSLVISGGAGAVLLFALCLRRTPPPMTRNALRFYGVAAAISYAIPNLLMFSAIPHLGAGYTGIMFTLSPVITLALSLLLRVRRPNRLGMLGIAVGFAGALIVALTRGEAGRPADIVWVIFGLLVPVSLACGNIYRTWDWPKDVGPIQLAAGSHLAAAVLLVAVLLAAGDTAGLAGLTALPWLVAAQIASASLMFVFFFRLQAVGGPVYLSQIGYVAAAVGFIAGTVFLGERYQLLTWVGAAIIAAGVAITTRAQQAEAA